MNVPYLVAHRGYKDKYPENTLIGIEAALEAGALYVEFDLQLTADQVFVAYHDDNLQRVSGVDTSLFSLNYDALKNFEANEYRRFNHRFEGIKIPTLEQVIALFQQYPDAIPLIEIKEECLAQFGTEKIMAALLDALKPLQQRCYILSFDYDALDYVRTHSSYRIGYVLRRYDEFHHQQAETLQPELLICNHAKLPEDTAPWPGPWQWMLYQIEDAKLALHYAELGVDLIETDFIGTLLQHPVLGTKHHEHTPLQHALL